jgi:hypothetical protein
VNHKKLFKILSYLLLAFTPLASNCSSVSTASEISPSAIAPQLTPSLTSLPATTTSMPTLTSDQRFLQIKEWLITNAGCELPCWWGIEPGRSTWDEVSELLSSIGTTAEVYKLDGTVVHEAKNMHFAEDRISNLISFMETQGIVTAITIDSSGYNDSPMFKSIWMSFSPENIMLKYGEPSRVWIYSISAGHEGEQGPTVPYSIWLFYDHLGALIRYDGQVENEAAYKMCPVFGDQGNLSDYINIYLQSSTAKTPIEALSDVDAYGKKPLLLEDAAAMNLSDFYGLFTEPGVGPCLETSRDVWK